MDNDERSHAQAQNGRRLVPVALVKPTLAAALGIDGGAIFQILAVEDLGLSAGAIGAAFGLAVLSVPIQVLAGRIPLRFARRNLQVFLVFAGLQCVLLAWLILVGATGGLAATALAITVTAEVAISVLFATAWQPLLAVSTDAHSRQRINAQCSAIGRGVLAGALVIFSLSSTLGRSLSLIVVGMLAIAVAGQLRGVRPLAAQTRTAAREVTDQPTAEGAGGAFRWIIASLIPINFGALPLWLVFLATVAWPEANLGLIGAIQTVAVVAALGAWKAAGDRVGRRCQVGALLSLSGTLLLCAVGPKVESNLDEWVVVVVTFTMGFGMSFASLALLEMAHRLPMRSDRIVRTFTLLDVADSTSLQLGLFVSGTLMMESFSASGWTYIGFVVATNAFAVMAIYKAVRTASRSLGRAV